MRNVETKPRWATIKTVPAKECNRYEDEILVELFAEIDHKSFQVLAYGLGPKDQKLAQRLANAWKAKAFFKKLVVKPCDPKAAPGKFYASVKNMNDFMPLGRMLNADLKRLGY